MSSESDDELPQLPPASADAGGTDPRETTATTTVPYFSSPSNKIFLSRKTSTRIGLACQMPPQDIVLEGKGIEEEHCIVEWPGAGAAVADGVEVASVRLHPIGSIQVNGVHTINAVLLTDGDIVKFGAELTFKFVYPPPVTDENLLLAQQLKALEAREEAMQKQEEMMEMRLKSAAHREKLAKLEAEGAAAALVRAAEQKRTEGEVWRAEREAKAHAATELADMQKRKMGEKIRATQQEQRRQSLAARLRIQAEQRVASAKVEAEQRLKVKLEAAEQAAKDEAREKRASEVETLRALKEEAEANLQSSLREFAEEEDARQALLDHLNAQEALREIERKGLLKAERTERRKLAFAVRAGVGLGVAGSLAAETVTVSTRTSYPAPQPPAVCKSPPPPIILPKPIDHPVSLPTHVTPHFLPRPSATKKPKPKPPKPKPKPKPPKPGPFAVADAGDGTRDVALPKPLQPLGGTSRPAPYPADPPIRKQGGAKKELSTAIPAAAAAETVAAAATAAPNAPNAVRGGHPPPPPAASLAKLVALKAKLATMQNLLKEKEEETAAAAAAPTPILSNKALIKMTHHWKEMLDNERRYHQDLNLLLYMRETMVGSKEIPGCIDSYQSKTIFGQ